MLACISLLKIDGERQRIERSGLLVSSRPLVNGNEEIQCCGCVNAVVWRIERAARPGEYGRCRLDDRRASDGQELVDWVGRLLKNSQCERESAIPVVLLASRSDRAGGSHVPQLQAENPFNYRLFFVHDG
jgi:hypothetical protein